MPYLTPGIEFRYSDGVMVLKSLDVSRPGETEVTWGLLVAVLAEIRQWVWELWRDGRKCRRLTWTVWDTNPIASPWEGPKITMQGSVEKQNANMNGGAVAEV